MGIRMGLKLRVGVLGWDRNRQGSRVAPKF